MADKHHVTPIKAEKKLPPSEPMPPTGSVVCGSYDESNEKLSETVGHARWHKPCGERNPGVIAKVKARA